MLQDAGDEVFCQRADLFLVRFIVQDIHILNVLVDVPLTLMFAIWTKWACASKQLKSQHSNRPVVDLVVVGNVLKQFWSKVIWCAAKRCSIFIYCMCTPAKVA